MNKQILKTNYYYEEYPIYDTLPDNLEPIEYTEQIFTKDITHKEILETLNPTIHNIEDAFRIACSYIQSDKKDYRIIYFKYNNGITCRLFVWLRDDGDVGVRVDEVVPDDEYFAGLGVLSTSNKVSDFLSHVALDLEKLSSLDSLTLDHAIKICKENGLKVTREKLVIEEL